MAFTASGIYVHTIQEALRATAITGTGGLDFRLATWRIALHNNSLTQGTAPIDYSAVDTSWAATNEVTGTGWNGGASGGHLLSAAAAGSTSTAPTLAEGTSGSLRYDMGDVSVASTTLTNAFGCIIYADNITAPTDLLDAMVVAVAFGSGFSTVNGTFGIQWAATGVFEIDLTP